MKLKFALWNAKAINQLIEHVFHVKIAARTVRLYMKILGFTPQRPEKRAREQNVQAVKEWGERKYLLSLFANHFASKSGQQIILLPTSG